MSDMKRRKFLKNSGVAAAAALGVSAFGHRRVLGANERLRVAVAGLHGRGGSHIDGFERQQNCEVVALCDPDEKDIERRRHNFKKKGKNDVAGYIDVRHLLEDESINILSIATPNHWHSLMAIWACQAGKDVYVEKPCSHNIHEGRKLVEAARKYKRIVQHGTQIRSSAAIQEAMQHLREGLLGEVYMARGLCYKSRNTIGKMPERDPPRGVHYDLWLGPAPKRAFTMNRFHYNWHWHWDYGNGDIGNQGVHQMDIARWGLGVGLPRKVQSMGGHFMFDDDQETPNTLISTFTYPEENKVLVFEVRHWYTNNESGVTVGNVFYGSEGYMVIPSYSSYRTYLGKSRKPGPAREAGGNHYGNFLDAVRQRDRGVLTAEIEEGHASAALCHLANASYRLGRTIDFDPETESAKGDHEAMTLLSRDYRAPYVVPQHV